MHTIAIVNEKGGTGKTTTAVNLSAALGGLGQKVLLVDLDGQAASSRWLGVEEDDRLAEALLHGEGLQAIEDVIPGVSLAPASGRLDSVAHELRPTQGGQLRKVLKRLEEPYDLVLMDCPPSLGNRLIGNALLAATHVIVPVETSILALDGLKILLTTIEDVREGFGHEIILGGVLACRYDGRTRLSRLVLEELRRALPGKVFQTVIRENVRMRECPASSQSILTFAPESHAAEDYRALAKEMLAHPEAWQKAAAVSEAEGAEDGQRRFTVANLRDNAAASLRESAQKTTRKSPAEPAAEAAAGTSAAATTEPGAEAPTESPAGTPPETPDETPDEIETPLEYRVDPTSSLGRERPSPLREQPIVPPTCGRDELMAQLERLAQAESRLSSEEPKKPEAAHGREAEPETAEPVEPPAAPQADPPAPVPLASETKPPALQPVGATPPAAPPPPKPLTPAPLGERPAATVDFSVPGVPAPTTTGPTVPPAPLAKEPPAPAAGPPTPLEEPLEEPPAPAEEASSIASLLEQEHSKDEAAEEKKHGEDYPALRAFLQKTGRAPGPGSPPGHGAEGEADGESDADGEADERQGPLRRKLVAN